MKAGVKSSQKRILFVSHEASHTGAPLFLLKFLRYLKIEHPEYGFAIFFTKYGELIELSARDGFEVYFSEKRGDASAIPLILWRRFIHYYHYLKIIYSYRPNLVYSNTIVNFGEVILAGLVRTPVIVHMHEGMSFSRTCRFRLRISCFFAKQIIVGSRYVNSVLTSLTGRVGVIVHNGVDFPVAMPAKGKLSAAPLVLGVLGTIDSNKGQLVAVEAIRILVGKGLCTKLKIAGKIGDEGYYAQLCSYVSQNSLDAFVEFVGVIPDVDVFMNSLDLLLVPSFDEAFPTVILEAFSTGTLVVASEVGGIPEMIENEINGFLFEAGNAMMLAAILEQIVNDTDVLGRLPLSALKTLKDKFDIHGANTLLAGHVKEILFG